MNPIAVTDLEGAEALSIGRSTFRRLVEEGVLPKPRRQGRMVRWDFEELRAAFRNWQREEAEAEDDGGWGDSYA